MYPAIENIDDIKFVIDPYCEQKKSIWSDQLNLIPKIDRNDSYMKKQQSMSIKFRLTNETR